MRTDLFGVASSLDPALVADAIPPECRRPVETAAATRLEDGHVVLDCGPWAPRERSINFIPSIALLGAVDYSVRFELAVEVGHEWSPWIGTATLGFAPMPETPPACEALTCDVDVFLAATPADRVRLRVRIAADDPGAVLRAPWLVTLSAMAPGDPLADRPPANTGPDSSRLSVPSWSQMEEPEPDRLRICSPTSVAMVLGYWGCPATPSAVAAAVYHPSLNRYGVWPAAIRAGGLHGVAGYLLRFPSWRAASWCLARGLPIVASLRWRRGELAGAPLDETDGHLVVLTGSDGGDVLVNDPAAPSRAEVPRRYRRDEVEPAWLGGSGVGYVFFPAPRVIRGG